MLGHDAQGKPIFLRDIWPSREEIQEVEKASVIPAMFKEVYSRIQVGNFRCIPSFRVPSLFLRVYRLFQFGNEKWNSLKAPETMLYPWDETSTYIKSPPFFASMVRALNSRYIVLDRKLLPVLCRRRTCRK